MAREKSPLTFAGALEVEAQKPLDNRRKVTRISDLTDAASFPYIYGGLDVYCEENKKWYTFLGGDSTDANNWRMEGSGGGSSTDWDDITNKPTDLAEAIELTQAEYNALTEAEKKNGKVYFITDGEGGGGGESGVVMFDLTQPVVYSEVDAAIESGKPIGFFDAAGNTILATGIQGDVEGRYFTGYFRGYWYTIIAREAKTAWDVGYKAVATQEYVGGNAFVKNDYFEGGVLINSFAGGKYPQIRCTESDGSQSAINIGASGIGISTRESEQGTWEAKAQYKPHEDTGWKALTGDYFDIAYRKENGIVYVTWHRTEGVKQAFEAKVPVTNCMLPEGFRPTRNAYTMVIAPSAWNHGYAGVQTGGAMRVCFQNAIAQGAETMFGSLSYPV